MSHLGESFETVAPASAPPCAFADALDHAVVAIDSELRVTAWNDAAVELYGIESQDAMGRLFSELVSCYPTRSLPVLRYTERSSGAVERDRLLRSAGIVSGPAMHIVGSDREVRVQVSVLPVQVNSRKRLHLLVINDDAANAAAAAALEERLDFEMLLSELCARFSSVAEEEIDGEIETWLARLVEALDVDRSSFAELKPPGLLVVTHSYALPPYFRQPRGPVNATLPWLTAELLAGRATLLTSIPHDVPADAAEERKFFAEVGMKSGIGIPTLISGAPVCVLTFGAFRRSRSWPADVVARLHIAGDAFGNAIARRESKRRLEEKQQELVHVGRVAALGELASVIAHELDQPLTVIASNAEALRQSLHADTPDLIDADDALWEISDAAMRVSEIVRRERKLLRKATGAYEPMDLNDVVREIELFLRAEARQFQSKLSIELVPGLPAVQGDRVQLQQVIFNLVRNAFQAMRANAADARKLVISTLWDNESVRITVSDMGAMIDPVVVRRMFEPFYTTKSDGLGMGLSISKSIVEHHRGQIWATPNPHGGLSMHVSLPRK